MKKSRSHKKLPEHLVHCHRAVPFCLVPSGILDGIGNTPMIHLKRVSKRTGCTILAKAEYLNPGGSIKHRIAKYMIEATERCKGRAADR